MECTYGIIGIYPLYPFIIVFVYMVGYSLQGILCIIGKYPNGKGEAGNKNFRMGV